MKHVPRPDQSAPSIDDAELLRRYVEERSEEAFTALVQRHVSVVYFAALRRVGGDRHLADDVTQNVFTALARKASLLKDRPVLTGWLYTSTRFAAAQAVRSERRRRTHEQEAHDMQEINATPEPSWEQLSPVIDEAMDELNERDREVVLLRFFENRPLAEIGVKYLLSPDAARMRVDRALEKLRRLLARRGVASTSTALAGVFAAQSSLAAPAGLVTSIVAGSIGQAGMAATTATLMLWKILTGLAVAGLGIGLIIHVVRQNQFSAPPPVTTTEITQPTGQMAVAASSPRSSVNDQGNVDAELSDAADHTGKNIKTTEDFGWPRVSLFAGEEREPTGHTIAEFRAKMEVDADFRETVTEQAKDQLDLFYGHLFKLLNLPESQLDQLKNLLVQKEQLGLDTAEAQQAVGYALNKNRGLLRETLAQGQQTTDAAIRALLGDSRYIQYLHYREDLVQWTAVNEVARKLQPTTTQLTDRQADELVALLRGSLLRIHSPFTFAIAFGAGLFPAHIGSGLNQHVFEQAGEFLSEPQVEVLRHLQNSRALQRQLGGN